MELYQVSDHHIHFSRESKHRRPVPKSHWVGSGWEPTDSWACSPKEKDTTHWLEVGCGVRAQGLEPWTYGLKVFRTCCLFDPARRFCLKFELVLLANVEHDRATSGTSGWDLGVQLNLEVGCSSSLGSTLKGGAHLGR